MDFTLKSANSTEKTVKITLDRLTIDLTDVKALLVLLGEYNKYGRNIPLEEHRENMIAFKDLIEKVGSKL